MIASFTDVLHSVKVQTKCDIMGNTFGSKERPTNSSPYYQQNINFGTANEVKPEIAHIVQLLNDKSQKLDNPGTMEDIYKDCKEVMPTFYEGARLILNNCLSNNLQLSHYIKLLPNNNESCYKFGANFVGNQRSADFKSHPILLGEIEKNGNMQAVIAHRLNDRMRMKLLAQYQGPHLLGAELGTEYKGDTFTASVGMINPNIINGSGIFCAQYLQSVTRYLALGSELMCQYGQVTPHSISAICNFISKYKGASSTFCTSIGKEGMRLSYVKEANPQLKVAVEFNANFESQNAFTTLGYHLNVPKANLNFRGSIDTNWNICSVMEKGLKPLPFTFSLSALLNQKSGQFKMGYGLVIG